MTDTANPVERQFTARPDPADFRDFLFSPTLVEVPPRISLATYLQYEVPVLDQGNEGACTGFGLATVANYLLRRRSIDPDKDGVSARMLYEMARRYDEWPGEAYSGSSARGAMKGWHKHGVCSDELWPYQAGVPDWQLHEDRANDALRRPLGAYYRVNHKDLVAMHSAIAEVGILYATGYVHAGWYEPTPDHLIEPSDKLLGGHAFALVAYNDDGFWVQNSWGEAWGDDGFALLTYDDWLRHGTDVWVARLGVPIRLRTASSTATTFSLRVTHDVSIAQAFNNLELRPHLVTVGNNGRFSQTGPHATREKDVEGFFEETIPRIMLDWNTKHLMLYVHGGLVSERDAVAQVANLRSRFMPKEVFPLAFVWRTDFGSTLRNILQDAFSRKKPEGIFTDALEFMVERLDDALEPLARVLSGKLQWDEMKENGILATKNEQGASRIVLKHVTQFLDDNPSVKLHLVAHSAGAIFLAPLLQLLATKGKIQSGPMANRTGYGRKIESCTLWAPAITTALFKQSYLPVIEQGMIDRFALYTLTDEAERDDTCANIYNKSILYLVAHALEEHYRYQQGYEEGEPLLGMQKFVESDPELQALFASARAEWVIASNQPDDSKSESHGDFDNDENTLRSTLARIMG